MIVKVCPACKSIIKFESTNKLECTYCSSIIGLDAKNNAHLIKISITLYLKPTLNYAVLIVLTFYVFYCFLFFGRSKYDFIYVISNFLIINPLYQYIRDTWNRESNSLISIYKGLFFDFNNYNSLIFSDKIRLKLSLGFIILGSILQISLFFLITT